MKPKVAFVCVHNSCRSQIAEALGKKLGADVFESYSAGTETKPQINQDAVRLMKELHGIDMEKKGYAGTMGFFKYVSPCLEFGKKPGEANGSNLSFLSPGRKPICFEFFTSILFLNHIILSYLCFLTKSIACADIKKSFPPPQGIY